MRRQTGRWTTWKSDRLLPFIANHLIQTNESYFNSTQVAVVAHVVSMQTQTTNTVYVLEDGTGQIEARHWIDENAGSRLANIK